MISQSGLLRFYALNAVRKVSIPDQQFVELSIPAGDHDNQSSWIEDEASSSTHQHEDRQPIPIHRARVYTRSDYWWCRTHGVLLHVEEQRHRGAGEEEVKKRHVE